MPRLHQGPLRQKRAFEGRLGLLADRHIREWYDDEAKGGRNRLSAITSVRKLSFLLERLRLDPVSVERMARTDPGGLRRLLSRYVTEATEGGRLPSYLRKLFASLRSYLKFRHLVFDDFPKLESIEGATLTNEKVPTQQELGVVLDRLSLRGRVVALAMANAGLRPQVIGGYEAARGLLLGDLPDLVLTPEIHFERVPFTILGRPELSKRRRAWTTFGTAQLATAIEAYLRTREVRGELLGPKSPLVTHNEVRGIARVSKEHARTKLGFLTTTHVTLEVGKVLHETVPKGGRWRPYCLRAYFRTGLLRAGVDRDLAEALMNHDTGVPGAYSVAKAWSDDLLEKARQEFERASEFLQTVPTPKVDVRAEVLSTLTKAIEEATGRKTDGNLRGEDLLRALREALGGGTSHPGEQDGSVARHMAPSLDVPSARRRGDQRVVSTEVVAHLLEQGWRFRSPLNSHQAVVEWVGTLGS